MYQSVLSRITISKVSNNRISTMVSILNYTVLKLYYESHLSNTVVKLNLDEWNSSGGQEWSDEIMI